MKQCTQCRGENRDDARFCGHCGQGFTNDPQRLTGPEYGNDKQISSKGLAIFLSLIWPGLGQLYKGQALKGIAFAVAHFILWKSLGPIFVLGIFAQSPISLVSLGIIAAFWIYGMVDAG